MSELPLSELMRRYNLRGIIALKGFPSTCKTEVAEQLGKWANCPVLCIQDFLGGAGDFGFEAAAADFSPPTCPDEVERHRQRAFGTLLKVAQRHLRRGVSNCVVIKSSLDTTHELQQLLELTRVCGDLPWFFRVVIIECKIQNEYLWRHRFHESYSDSRKWYRLGSWKDVEKARDDYNAAQSRAWDLHLRHLPLLKSGFDDRGPVYTPAVRWLVVDPFYDLFFQPHTGVIDRIDYPLPTEFINAMKYAIISKKKLNDQNPYVVEYKQLRRYLFEKELSAAESKPRTQNQCSGGCVFKYWEDYKADFCDVCGDHQVSGPAYTCYFCVSTLHKTCAEGLHNINAIQQDDVSWYFYLNFNNLQCERRPCKPCTQRGRDFSEECRSCLFQQRLKCDLLPTIVNHNVHQEHFLSIHYAPSMYLCKACGDQIFSTLSYGCKICALYYHLRCTSLPLELKHKHGGYNHTMKLMYSHDGLEQEEDYWCDVCYKDMDPQLWFYSCQGCPNYVAHLDCAGGYDQTFTNVKDVKYVDQVQSQLEEAIADQGIPNQE